MKTYDERLRSIQKKAKGKKAARLFTGAATAVLCLTVIVYAAVLLPQGNWFHQLGTPVMTAPSDAAPTAQQQPYPEPSTWPTSLPNTPLTDPANTASPPSLNDEPSCHLVFKATYIKTTQESGCDDYPAIHLLRSVDALWTFIENRNQQYINFEPVVSQALAYDDAFFAEKSLIVLMLEEGSGSIRHKVTDVGVYEHGFVNVDVERIDPEMGTCDMAYWYIFLEVDAIISDAGMLTFRFVNTPIVDELPGEEPADLLSKIPAWEQEKMKQVYIDQFTSPGDRYTAEDVWMLRVVAVLDRRYALFVEDNIFSYLSYITAENVDGVEFKYGSSQYMYLYYDGHYYRLQEAFDAGLISHDDLLQIQENYNNGYGVFPFA